MKVHPHLINNHAIAAKDQNFVKKAVAYEIMNQNRNMDQSILSRRTKTENDETSFLPQRDISPDQFIHQNPSITTLPKDLTNVPIEDSQSTIINKPRVMSGVTQKPLDEYQR